MPYRDQAWPDGSTPGWQWAVQRRVEELERRMSDSETVREKYLPIINGMVKSDELAAAVETLRRDERKLVLSMTQKLAGTLVSGLVIADLVRGLL